MRTGPVDRVLELGEGDDLVEALADLRALEAVDRAVQEDVLAPAEVGVEAGAELEQRADPAADLDAPDVGLMIPAIRRSSVDLPEPLRPTRPTASPGSTASETSWSACTSWALGAAAEDEQLLQAARLVRVDAEAARDPLDADLARLHACLTPGRYRGVRRTRAASTRMNAGSAFGSSIRSSRSPSSRARSAASTSRSQRISRWSATKPIGQRSDVADVVRGELVQVLEDVRPEPGLAGRRLALEGERPLVARPRARRRAARTRAARPGTGRPRRGSAPAASGR